MGTMTSCGVALLCEKHFISPGLLFSAFLVVEEENEMGSIS